MSILGKIKYNYPKRVTKNTKIMISIRVIDQIKSESYDPCLATDAIVRLVITRTPAKAILVTWALF